MKLWWASLTVVLALHSASAQLFSPASLQFGLLGAFIGGAAGDGRHCGWSGDGAAIGAGVGLVAGALISESRRQQYYNSPYDYPPPAYSYYEPVRPNYAVSGALLGAASGALIGEGTSRQPGRGAAIGAAAGLVLGSVAESQARQREAASVIPGYPAPVPAVAGARASVWSPGPVPRFQIPDAPRVPAAPTF